MLKKLFQVLINSQLPLKARLLYVVGILSTVGTFCSFIITLLPGVLWVTRILALICFLASISLFIYIMKTTNYTTTINIICIVYNIFLLPVTFFLSGGLNSGMPFYFILGIFASFVLLESRKRFYFSFFILLYDLIIFLISFFFPNCVVNLSSKLAATIDSVIAFFVVTVFICAVIYIITKEHDCEHKKVEKFNQYLQEQSIHDPLTNLFNRRYLLNILDKRISDAKETGKPLCVIMFDIDLFKHVNDTYGHLTGDEVLRNFSQLLLMETLENNIAGRYGGEEFLIVLTDTTVEKAYEFGEYIRNTVFSCSLMDSQVEPITVSGGIGVYQKGMTVQNLIDNADQNLYKAKHNGRNLIVK